MDMGFIKAGFDIVYSNEYDSLFAQIHDEGMSSWSEKHGLEYHPISSTESIVDLSPEEILKSAFGDTIPPVWGIIGGPPCQDFTMMGNGNGFSGERGKMTQIFFNRIKKMKPSFFVMENVTGLLKRKEQKYILDSLLLKHICPDYYIDRKTLNALEYGVPQDRHRIFIVGFRKDVFHIDSQKTPSMEDISSIVFPWPKAKYPKALSVYNWPGMNPFGSTDVTKDPSIPIELCVQSCIEGAKEVANGKEFASLTKNPDEKKEIFEGDTKRRSYRRLHRYRYSPTLCFGNNEVFLHPYENRRLSVREASRLQGVDDGYVLGQGRLTAKFRVIGNGVPVPLAESVALSVKQYIMQYFKQ